MVRARVRAVSRSNLDPVVEGVTCAVAVQEVKEKRPLSLLCFFCKEICSIRRAKQEGGEKGKC